MIIQESDWYIAALLGKMPPIHEDSAPEAGFYKVRLESRGAFYPARVWIEEERDDVGELLCDVLYFCEVNGDLVEAWDWWLRVCKNPISRNLWEQMEDERLRQSACGIAG